jgi:AAA family ATP:ADP antiporter
MVSRLIRAIYGDISAKEIKKYSLLSMTFFFVIGTYWLLRPLKDAIFFGTVGGKYQPLAKTFSAFVVIAIVLIYSKLVDMYEKHKLFYIIGTFYALVFLVIAMYIAHPVHGTPSTDLGAHRWLGWLTYFSIESFGSVVVALFWSFVASITDSASAKRGYPIIIAGAQVGGIVGPWLVTYAESLGLTLLALVAVGAICAIMLMVMYFMLVTPASELHSGSKADSSSKKKTGFLEGLRLILTRPYILGIFAIVTLYEVVSTIVDYQMKMAAKALPEYASTEAFARFLGQFGMATNGIALAMALLGTSYLMRRFGLVFCLLAFPTSLAIAIGVMFYSFKFAQLTPHTELTIIFTVMIISKGLSYALNNPAKDMMYIPTSKDAKFKSKGWIDMFGSRFAKALGSQVTGFFKNDLAMLMVYGSLASLGLIGIWLGSALFVGRKFTKLTESGDIVE